MNEYCLPMKNPDQRSSVLHSKKNSSTRRVCSVGSCMRIGRQTGTTLIELLIVLAIIGILSQVAVPGFSKYIVESRRSDAHHLLQSNAQLLQRCLTLAGRYTGCNTVNVSRDGHYELTSVLADQTWSLSAKAVEDGKQQKDTDCTTFNLNHIGLRSAAGNQPDACW